MQPFWTPRLLSIYEHSRLPPLHCCVNGSLIHRGASARPIMLQGTQLAALPVQARKAGHLEQDGADKQDLHKFADRLHTVLRNPIDTSLLGKVVPCSHALCM